MRRATQILIGILLGALTTGLGVGIFLWKANSDRKTLAAELTETRQDAQRSREENRRAVEEANRKLQEANSEVEKAQGMIEALAAERRLIANAEQLLPASGYTTYRWNEIVSLDLGLALKMPPETDTIANDGARITAALTSDADATWLSITPYSPEAETDELRALSATSTVTYLIQDRVITGLSGDTDGRPDPVYVLRIQKNGEPSHLLRIRDPLGRTGARSRVKDILATITFAPMR